MILRASPHLRQVGWLPIGWLLVLLLVASGEVLQWMRTRSLSHTGRANDAKGFSASHSAQTGSRMLSVETLPRPVPAAPSNGAPLLLVSVTDVEVRAVLGMVPGALPTVIGNRTYYDLGMIGEARTYLVQATGMGPSDVRACIEDGMRTLAPCALILVGIAFGLQPERQQIGDILLSR